MNIPFTRVHELSLGDKCLLLPTEEEPPLLPWTVSAHDPSGDLHSKSTLVRGEGKDAEEKKVCACKPVVWVS